MFKFFLNGTTNPNLYLWEALAAEGAEQVVEGLAGQLGGQVAHADKDDLQTEVHVAGLDVLLQLQHGPQAGQLLPPWNEGLYEENTWVADPKDFCSDPDP